MWKNCKNFVFGAYMSPPPENTEADGKNLYGNPNFHTVKAFRELKDCGFNRAIGLYDKGIKDVTSALEVCEKLGIEYYARDFFAIEPHIKLDDESFVKEIENSNNLIQEFDAYTKYKCFKGCYTCDEPGIAIMGKIKKGIDFITKKYDVDFEVNLLPDYANFEQLTGEKDKECTYQAYVDSYIDIIKPSHISYDFYALMKDLKTGKLYIRPTFLNNLNILAKKAKETGLDFGCFLLILGHWDYRQVSTYADVAWQVYNALAFGVKIYQVFTYWGMYKHKAGDGANVTTAMVDLDGTLLPVYYVVQTVIKELKFLESAYFNYRWNKVIYNDVSHNEQFKYLANTDDEYIKLDNINSTEDIIIGCFDNIYNKNKGYVITNFTDPCLNKSVDIKIQFEENSNILIYKNCKLIRKNNLVTLDLSLKSGEGVFIELIKEK